VLAPTHNRDGDRRPEDTQPGSFDPGCAEQLSTIDYVLSANVTAEALASGEASVSALSVA
jgi:hypothetical protein